MNQAEHTNTKLMLDAWQRLITDTVHSDPNGRAVGPNEPLVREHPGLLSRLFILQRTIDSQYVFRSAGSQIKLALGRDVTDHDFLSLWHTSDRALITGALKTLIADRGPGRLIARGDRLRAIAARLEITLAPLDLPGAPRPRFLGLYQTISAPTRHTAKPILTHKLQHLHMPAPMRARPELRLVSPT